MADEIRYYRVSPRFWSTTRHWSEDARTLGLYLLTCQHRTVEGLFWLPKAYVCADLQWSPERLTEPFAELIADGFIEYDDAAQVVLITKALKYQAPANPNGVKAALRQVEQVPESPLDQRLYQLAERFCERLAEGLPERFRQPLGEPPAPTPAPTPTPAPARERASDDRSADVERPANVVQLAAQGNDTDDPDNTVVDELIRWFVQALQANGQRPRVDDRKTNAWRKAFRRIGSQHDATAREIWLVIDWVGNHDFWSTRVTGPGELANHYPKLRASAMADAGWRPGPVSDVVEAASPATERQAR